MAPVRRNILSSKALQESFVQGVKRLKAEAPASAGGLSTYDTFVLWHHRAMMTLTPPQQGDRNAAHSGPAFLPWHRYMLLVFERQLQRVLEDPGFGLPYWAWEVDGNKTASAQKRAPIWRVIGGDGVPVASGPFRRGQWSVRLEQDPNTGDLVSVDRGLNRQFGAGPSPRLPKRADAERALEGTRYDAGPWSRSASPSFRNDLEGWSPPAPGLHNLVHVWVGGDMLASTSPNDPVFYLNHCNVDRLWAAWQEENGEDNYAPAQGDKSAPAGHRPRDRLFVLDGPAPRISEMFDVSEIYTYDALAA